MLVFRYKLFLCYISIKSDLPNFSRKLILLYIDYLATCVRGLHQKNNNNNKNIFGISSTFKHTIILQNALSSFPVYIHPCLF